MFKRFPLLLLLVAAFTRTSAAAPEQWVEVHSTHFTVFTNDGDKQGRHLLDQFERMRWVFHTMFPNMNTDPSAPIEVFACKNGKSFNALEPAVYLSKGQIRLAGLFLRTEDRNYVLLRLDASDEEHPFSTVYHEYTHLLLAGSQEWIPLWLNEGLAEFFQNTTIRNKDVSLGQGSRDNILFLRENGLIPLPVLFKVDYNSPYYHEESKGGIFYAESWALTHMIQINDQLNKTHRMRDYGVLLTQHYDPVAAAEKAFGDLKKLQAELEYYIHSSMYREFVMNSAAAPIDESGYTATVLTQAQADAARADVMASVGRTQDARTLLNSVLKPDPSNVPARETLGMLALREHNNDEALKWYSEAVKLDSKSYLAHYYFAQISMQQPGGDKAAVVSSLREAIKLNPSFAPAYNQLAMLYGMHHENLEEAQKLIVKAIELDPSQIAFRLNASGILMATGNYAGARRIAEACVKLAHNPEEAAMVQSRMQQLQQVETAMAEHASSPVVSIDAEAGPRVITVAKDEPPKHPTEPSTGPKHSFLGVMRQVSCSYPAVLELKLEGAKKSISLYTNNYVKIDLSAVGFTPSGSMDPCHDFEGKTAWIQYAEVSDKTVDGQVIAIELHK